MLYYYKKNESNWEYNMIWERLYLYGFCYRILVKFDVFIIINFVLCLFYKFDLIICIFIEESIEFGVICGCKYILSVW